MVGFWKEEPALQFVQSPLVSGSGRESGQAGPGERQQPPTTTLTGKQQRAGSKQASTFPAVGAAEGCTQLPLCLVSAGSKLHQRHVVDSYWLGSPCSLGKKVKESGFLDGRDGKASNCLEARRWNIEGQVFGVIQMVSGPCQKQ